MLDTFLACPRCDKTPLEHSDGQFSCKACKIDFPSIDDVSGASGLPYDIWTDGVVEFLTVYRSAEDPPGVDEHYFR